MTFKSCCKSCKLFFEIASTKGFQKVSTSQNTFHPSKNSTKIIPNSFILLQIKTFFKREWTSRTFGGMDLGFLQNSGIDFYPYPEKHSNHSWINLEVLLQEKRKAKSRGICPTSKEHFGNIPCAIAIKIYIGRFVRNERISNVLCTKPIYWYFIHIDGNYKFPHEAIKYVIKWQSWDGITVCFSERCNFLLFVFYQFISIFCDVVAVDPTKAMIIFLTLCL